MTQLTVFILIIGIVRQTNGQTCTWSWTTPSESSLTLSVGAPATFTASVNDVLTNNDLLTWKIGTEELLVEQYIAASTSFNILSDPEIVTTSFTAGGSGNNMYTMSYQTAGVPQTHNGRSITVTSQGCVTGGTSPGIALTVRYCDLSYYGTAATATVTTDDCGYNCERTFTCASDLSRTFTSVCQAAADWSVSDASSACSAGVREGAILGLVILCSILSAVHLI